MVNFRLLNGRNPQLIICVYGRPIWCKSCLADGWWILMTDCINCRWTICNYWCLRWMQDAVDSIPCGVRRESSDYSAGSTSMFRRLVWRQVDLWPDNWVEVWGETRRQNGACSGCCPTNDRLRWGRMKRTTEEIDTMRTNGQTDGGGMGDRSDRRMKRRTEGRK